MSKIGSIIVWVSMVLPLVANASSIVNTNVGEVVVAQHNNFERAALAQVIVKMSGDTASVRNETIRQALRQSDNYLASYEYLVRNGVQLYRAVFDRQKVQQLIKQANLPLWGARRPDAVLWLAINSDNDIQVLSDFSESSEVDAIKRHSSSRGVNVLLPLMDLEDSMSVGPIDVWGRFMPVIEQASQRYNADFVIAARVGSTEALRQRRTIAESIAKRRQIEQPEFIDSAAFAYSNPSIDQFLLRRDALNDQTINSFNADEFDQLSSDIDQYAYVLDWTVQGEGGVTSGQLFGNEKAILMNSLIDLYTDGLASKYAISAAQTGNAEVTLSIANIQSLNSSVALTRYLTDLTVVQSAQLTQMQGKVATFEVVLIGELADLIATLELDKKLIPIDNSPAEAEASQVVVNLFWDE